MKNKEIRLLHLYKLFYIRGPAKDRRQATSLELRKFFRGDKIHILRPFPQDTI
jgi:hypothetical protein